MKIVHRTAFLCTPDHAVRCTFRNSHKTERKIGRFATECFRRWFSRDPLLFVRCGNDFFSPRVKCRGLSRRTRRCLPFIFACNISLCSAAKMKKKLCKILCVSMYDLCKCEYSFCLWKFERERCVANIFEFNLKYNSVLNLFLFLLFY